MPRRDIDDLWQRFTRITPARIALGRSGDALPTQRLLDFGYAHANARDAVTAQLDFAAVARELKPTASIHVRSCARDRSTYLRRPDLGRALEAGDVARLPQGPYDAVFVIADGLSAGAARMHAVPVFNRLAARLATWRIGPVVLAEQARVALGDSIGAAMHATMVVVLIGERPGLSVPDSLGIYLTYGPQVGRRDSERNCISNVHAHGLSYDAAAATLEWLMTEALGRRLTGVALKEDAPRRDKPVDSRAPILRSSKP